jgi:copper(I)-binding protein
MSTITRRRAILAISSVLALAACGKAADTAPSKITVKSAWMRVPPGGRDVSAAYLVIRNDGGADTLMSVSSPMADDVQMHISEMSDDVMSMREESTVPIPANSTINYQPGGRHLMVFGVREGLKAGDEVPFILTFLHAGKITVTAIMGNGPA